MPRFENVGLYDALFIMQDVESKTLWNHMTGEALYGPHVGRTLGPMGNLLQMSVEQALVYGPEMQLAISDRPYLAGGREFGNFTPGPERLGPRNVDERMQGMFIETLGTEDARFQRMSMGLGIVTADTLRFYPMDLIEEHGALIDEIDGRRLLLFVDSKTFTPAAIFVDASSATLQDREVHLEGGGTVKMGALYDAAGARLDAERPQQFFSRWYGLALTFPGMEIFGS